jgi:Asp-tRNA(Asn)/Glu-tRNA(Gln) amidotransferase A subunit family amidase
MPAGGYVAHLSDTSLVGKKIGLFGTGFKNVTVTAETQGLYTNAINLLKAQGATVVSDPFAGTTFNTIGATFSSFGGLSLPYDINQWMANLGPNSPHSTEEFKAKTGIDLLASGGALIGNTATNPLLAYAVAHPNEFPDLTPFFQGRQQMLAAFNAVMDQYDLDALFFPQMFDKVPALFSGNYRNTSVSEINLLGTPGVNLSGGYYADGTPFSVQFLGKQWSEGDLLSYAYDFEQASILAGLSRQAPVLVPEPSTMLVLGLGVTGLLVKRRRAA